MQECGELGRLKDLERAASVDTRHAERQAVPVWIVDVIAVDALLSDAGRPWRQLDLPGFQPQGQIVEVEHVADVPDTRQIRVAVRQARRCRGGQIRLAVRQARNPGCRPVHPLRLRGA
jgi:hypothetical protein